ncbi:26616_t:CDS:1, partial [Racocetra persica]
LRELPVGSIGHLLGPLWQTFYPIKTDKKLKAKCIFCNPTKFIFSSMQVMGSHIKKCIDIHGSWDSQSEISTMPSMSISNCGGSN